MTLTHKGFRIMDDLSCEERKCVAMSGVYKENTYFIDELLSNGWDMDK